MSFSHLKPPRKTYPDLSFCKDEPFELRGPYREEVTEPYQPRRRSLLRRVHSLRTYSVVVPVAVVVLCYASKLGWL